MHSPHKKKKVMEECWIHRLPNELLLYIFDYTRLFDVESIVRVCQRWHQLGKSSNWYARIQSQYELVEEDKHKRASWERTLAHTNTCYGQWIPICAVILRCIETNGQELGTLLYYRLLQSEAPDFVRFCLYRHSIDPIFQEGRLETVVWLDGLPHWDWPGVCDEQLRRFIYTGRYCILDWFHQRRMLRSADDSTFRCDMTSMDFLRPMLLSICEHSRLEDLKLFSQRMQEHNVMRNWVLCNALGAGTVMILLAECSDECACFLLTDGILQLLPITEPLPTMEGGESLCDIVLRTCVLKGSLQAAEILVQRCALTGEDLARALLYNIPKRTEELFYLLLPHTWTWAAQRLGLRWDMLPLNPLRIVLSMVRSHSWSPEGFRAFLELVPDLPDSLWDYILKSYYRPGTLGGCCGAAHFVLSQKTHLLQRKTVIKVVDCCVRPCVQIHAREQLFHVTKQVFTTATSFPDLEPTPLGWDWDANTTLFERDFLKAIHTRSRSTHCGHSCCPYHTPLQCLGEK